MYRSLDILYCLASLKFLRWRQKSHGLAISMGLEMELLATIAITVGVGTL